MDFSRGRSRESATGSFFTTVLSSCRFWRVLLSFISAERSINCCRSTRLASSPPSLFLKPACFSIGESCEVKAGLQSGDQRSGHSSLLRSSLHHPRHKVCRWRLDRLCDPAHHG